MKIHKYVLENVWKLYLERKELQNFGGTLNYLISIMMKQACSIATRLSLYNIFTNLQIIDLLFNDHLCTLWVQSKLVVILEDTI